MELNIEECALEIRDINEEGMTQAKYQSKTDKLVAIGT